LHEKKIDKRVKPLKQNNNNRRIYMKMFLSTMTLVLAFSANSQAVTGTSSTGGLFAPNDKTTRCSFDDRAGHAIQLTIQTDNSDGNSAYIQESTLNGFFGPVTFSGVSSETRGTILRYQAPGMTLAIDLTTGLNSLPPRYAGQLTARGVNQSRPVSVFCTL
jgi:hypothetical protein